MWITDLQQMQQYYGTWVTLRGGHVWEGRTREGNQKLECG
jgi:hypothetical protein